MFCDLKEEFRDNELVIFFFFIFTFRCDRIFAGVVTTISGLVANNCLKTRVEVNKRD